MSAASINKFSLRGLCSQYNLQDARHLSNKTTREGDALGIIWRKTGKARKSRRLNFQLENNWRLVESLLDFHEPQFTTSPGEFITEKQCRDLRPITRDLFNVLLIVVKKLCKTTGWYCFRAWIIDESATAAGIFIHEMKPWIANYYILHIVSTQIVHLRRNSGHDWVNSRFLWVFWS